MASYNSGRSGLFGTRVGSTSTNFTERIQEQSGKINTSFRSFRDFENMSRPKTFDLSVRNSIFGQNDHQNSRLIQESSTSSRPFYLGATTSKFGSGLASQKRFNRDFRNGEQSLSVFFQSYDLQSNVSTTNLSHSSRGFEPVNKCIPLGSGWAGHDMPIHENDDDGFKRPLLMSKPIKGRNSIFSTRLFSDNSIYKNGSHINSYNVTNVSRRGFDTLSDSRFETGHNGTCNQSVTDSVVTVAALKNEMVDLLENLHTSILNWAPNLPFGSALDMEFKKAKQKIENIREISFAPSIGDIDSASVSNYSHKNLSSRVPNITSNEFANGTTLGLNSGNSIVGQLNYTTTTRPLDRVDEENESSLKTPRKFTKIISKSQMKKIKTPKATRSESSKNYKAINLKQWYPIAVGGDLAFCGVNDEGTFVKTEAVKKKLKNGQIALTNGVVCSLIGSPSNLVVSAFPQKILSRLKNGLTNQWRQLQKDLVSCQTSETDLKRKHSKSPKKATQVQKALSKKTEKKQASPKKVVKEVSAKKIEKKPTSPKKIVKEASPRKIEQKNLSPKKASQKASPRKDSSSCRTRSGREVRRPGYFWIPPSEMTGPKSPLKTQSYEITYQKTQKKVQESPEKQVVKEVKKTPTKKSIKTKASSKTKSSVKRTLTKQSKSSTKKTPTKKVKGSTLRTPTKKLTSGEKVKSVKSINRVISTPLKKVKRGVASIAKKLSQSPSMTPIKAQKTGAKDSGKSTKRKASPKVLTPKKVLKKVVMEESTVSTEDSISLPKDQKSQAKRKRGATEDVNDTQKMGARPKKQAYIKMDSSIDDWETPAKKSKKSKTSSEAKKKVVSQAKDKKTTKKETKETDGKLTTISEASSFIKETSGENEGFDVDFEFQSGDMDLPDLGNVSGNPLLTRSQLRVVSMETPPLKFFNNNLRLIRTTTPVQSPEWCISQRTETEFKQFQKRRAEDLKKKMKVEETKTIVHQKTKNFGKKGDLNKVLNWVAERNIRSPMGHSKVLQYMLPSRKKMEQEEEDEEEDENYEI